MTPVDSEILSVINKALKEKMTDAERLEAISILLQGICRECGCVKDGVCHCTSEE